MSATVVPVPQYENATPLVRTVDGELISDLSGPAPYAPLVQTLADRGQYARGGLWGHLEWSGRFAVDPGGTSTVFVVRVGAIEAICLCQGGDGLTTGTWRPHYNSAETTLALSDVEGAPAALSADTWYYVYAWSNGTLKFLINTTPPSVGLIWQSAGGAPTRRYLGCFRTDSAGAPIPVRAHRGRYLYDYCSVTVGTLRVLNNGTSSPAFATVSCAALVPPHVRAVTLRCVFLDTAPAARVASLRTTGTATTAWVIDTQTGVQQTHLVPLLLDASQRFDYESGAATGQLTAHVAGWEE